MTNETIDSGLFQESQKLAELMETNIVFGGTISGEKYLTLQRGKHRHSVEPQYKLLPINSDDLKKAINDLS